MTRFSLAALVAGALMTGAALAATAGEYGNMCALGYALEKDVATDCSVNAVIDGKTYCFGNEDAKTIFMKDPKANLAKAESFAATKKK